MQGVMVNSAKRATPVDLPACDEASLGLLAGLAEPIWVYDFDCHRIVWCNLAALALWNAASLAELQGRDFLPVAHGTQQRMDNLRQRLAGGEIIRDDWTLYPLGNPCQLECQFSGVRLANDAVGMLVAAKPQAGKIGTSDFELRTIEAVRHTPLMISMVTGAGHWLMHNPAAEQLMLMLRLGNLPHFDNFLALFAHREEAAALRMKALAEGSAEATLRIMGEDYRMHEVSLRRLADPASGRLSLMLSQQDVTLAHRLDGQLKQALAKEQAINEAQRQFLLLTSHDFRTPLAVIDGAARRIGKLVIDNPTVTERVGDIRKAARRMVEAVDNTLATARIAEGKFGIELRRGAIGPIIEQAIANQRALHPGRRFDVDLPFLSQLQLDPALIEQVLENLLSNAIKYSPADSPIAVAARLHAETIVVTITDHGIGVPAEDMPKLFTRFYRCSNVGGVKGTGVGLHAVRFFMELHGGTVTMTSEEGAGSTVTLTLPLPAS